MMKPSTHFFRAAGLLAGVVGLSSAVFAKEPAAKPVATPQPEAQQAAFNDPFATESESEEKPQIKVSDPLEPMNRVLFKFNDRLYFWFLKPVATGYKTVTPRRVRESLALFFLNIKYPGRLANNLLEGRVKEAGIETTRFLVNTTVGVGGLFDPADHWNLKAQKADFDQTLGFYHVPTGCYIVWPFLGPSSVRGTVGMAGDAALSPFTYIGDGADWLMVMKPAEILNTTSLRLGEYEAFKKSNLDPYVAMRSSFFEYWQHRDKKTKAEKP